MFLALCKDSSSTESDDSLLRKNKTLLERTRMFQFRKKIVTHKNGTTKKFVMQGKPIQRRCMHFCNFLLLFTLCNDIFHVFLYSFYLVRRRRVLMPSFVEADQSVYGPPRVRTVGQPQPENGAQSVDGNLGAAGRAETIDNGAQAKRRRELIDPNAPGPSRIQTVEQSQPNESSEFELRPITLRGMDLCFFTSISC